ncbi:MAG: hypothetical protein OXC28_03800 [Defluviicoccus sp.]|nr:hypothetical protein [Defluviicoccus sp.]
MANPHLVCTSHSPILYLRPRKPACEDEIFRVLAERREAVRAFDPEIVFVFGADHYAGFHLNAMPSFCIGRGDAAAVDDVGGFPGPLDVDREAGLGLLEFLRREGFDPAQSLRMTVDHGFSQTMKNVLGALDAYACVPVFISAMTTPFLPFRRSRELGAAVGRYAAVLERRVLFLASGGLSHHPARYYPPIGEGSPEVEAWQMAGSAGGSFTDEAWFRTLFDMHVEGARMLADGRRGRADVRLNPEVDRAFLDILSSGDLAPLDAWDVGALFETAGIGFTEVHGWIAAVAANLACGGNPPAVDFYLDALEYAIGYGIVHAG